MDLDEEEIDTILTWYSIVRNEGLDFPEDIFLVTKLEAELEQLRSG